MVDPQAARQNYAQLAAMGALGRYGFYEALEVDGLWRVTLKIPFDSANYIRSQALTVDVAPGKGLTVVDTLMLNVGAPYGFAFRINNDVKFSDVRLDGTPAKYVFGGGIVWIDTPKKAGARLALAYTLAASGRSAGEGAARVDVVMRKRRVVM